MSDTRQIRTDTLKARDQLSREEIVSKSSAIARTVLNLEEIRHGGNIFIYVNFRSEVMTTGIIASLLAQSKKVSVPLTRAKDNRLDIISIIDPDNDLAPGYFGIPEPREEIAAIRTIDPAVLDVIVLPGSVFDLRCGRFGYGGGYYDRLLSQIPHAQRVGLAFELQITDNLPLQAHDELLDCVVTEKRVIRGAARQA